MVKKLIVLLLSLLLIMVVGCEEKEKSQGKTEGQQGKENQEEQKENLYTGFMKPSKGQWVEYVSNVNGQAMEQKIECIGEEVVDGEMCIGFETSMDMKGNKVILQMWVDSETGGYVKYVIKMNDQVFCISPSMVNQKPPATKTPDAYSPDKLNYTLGTYTVPRNNQTINVAIFHGIGSSETWVSSEVPFGMVKVVDERGDEVLHLENFGLSGAHRDISAEERDNCQSFPSFP